MIPHDEIETHQLNCPFIKSNCKNPGCSTGGTKLQIEEHQKECLYKTIECDKCLLKLQKQQEKEHNCIKALSERLAKMESVFENLAKREEEEDLFKIPAGGIVRFI